MKKLSLLIISMMSTFFLMAQTPGTLDPSFGNNGSTLISFGNTVNICFASAIQPDQKIVLAGRVTNSSSDIAFARLNTDGSLDESFGSGGILQSVYNSTEEYLYDVVVQPDGKIVAIGYTAGGGSTNFILVRLNSDGSFDNSFSGNGMRVVDFGPAYQSFGMSLALQDDGKIIAAGNTSDLNYNRHCAICRVNANGSIDASFGSNGYVIMSLKGYQNYINNVELQGDDIIVGGYSYYEGDHFVTIAKFNSFGNLIYGFGDSGVASDTLSMYPVVLSERGSMCIDPSGRIYYGTYYEGSIYSTFAVYCFTPEGQIDLSYGDLGYTVALFGQDSYIHSITAQYDGKILAGGVSIGDNDDFALARFEVDGDPDPTFGTDGNGMVLSNISTTPDSPNDRIISLQIQDDGMIIAAGKGRSVAGGMDFAVARYYSGLNVGIEDEITNKAINIYPNPADEFLHIQSQLKIDRISIVDINGKLCYEGDIENTRISIPVTDLNNGVYILKGLIGQDHFNKKFIIHHP